WPVLGHCWQHGRDRARPSTGRGFDTSFRFDQTERLGGQRRRSYETSFSWVRHSGLDKPAPDPDPGESILFYWIPALRFASVFAFGYAGQIGRDGRRGSFSIDQTGRSPAGFLKIPVFGYCLFGNHFSSFATLTC
ncbi:MAG: hypothetical protein K9L59_14455, partial [Desulfobacterales bacterium]|nr:hypothetical protein [Desulfobacterales bacterium]